MTAVAPGETRSGSMAGFRHVTPAFRTFAGPEALASLGRELDRLAAHGVVVITSASMVSQSVALNSVETAIGSRLVGRFAGVKPHSPLPAVMDCVAALREAAADAVVVVGGGSAVVTARAAVIVHGENEDVRRLCTRRDGSGRLVSPRLAQPKLPAWVVPSTPTTAYAKAGAAVCEPETGERLALFDPAARAQGVFFDPAVAGTAPTSLVKSSILNAFAMAIESVQANDGDPMADAPLTHALTLIRESMPQLLDESEPDLARQRLLTAALLCGQGTDFAGGGLAQTLAHAVGPRSRTANGIVEAILLPHAIEFNNIQSPERLRRIAWALGDYLPDAPSAASLKRTVEAMLGEWQVPLRLREVGVDRSALAEAAKHAMDDWAITQVPRRVELADVMQLLESAW
jgi:alcohol dehydrogenase class IV